MLRPRRPYDTTRHRQERARWKRIVERGQAWCAEFYCLEPDRWIEPGSAWDLAHDLDGTYLGAAHARCNRSEGARRGNAMRGGFF
jgi:hypothetical protein